MGDNENDKDGYFGHPLFVRPDLLPVVKASVFNWLSVFRSSNQALSRPKFSGVVVKLVT